MKTLKNIIGIVTLSLAILASCTKEEGFKGANKDIQLPPQESMDCSFDQLQKSSMKSGSAIDSTMTTYTQALSVANFWRGAVWLATSVPTAAFYASFTKEAELVDDYTWQWSYSVNEVGATYNARLIGVADENFETIEWTMYLSKDGIGGFDEFIWFEGTSNIANTSGNWILYHSNEYQVPFITLDWEASNGEISKITYTYVREEDNYGNTDELKGSYITYGKQEGELDAYFDVHYFRSFWFKDWVDVDINWSTTEYKGNYKQTVTVSPFNANTLYCWDSNGYDVSCE